MFKDLKELGIDVSQIKIRETGNYWRYHGKDFLLQKNYELTFNDFKEPNQLAMKLRTRGIHYLRIGQLKHKNLSLFREEVKIKALQEAKRKADYLLKSMDQKRGNMCWNLCKCSINHTLV